MSEEKRRLEALYSFNVLDSEEEHCFDELTRLAAIICNTPISMITLIDQDRQWFKSKMGVTIKETHRSIAFCQGTILQDDIFEICDTRENELTKDNPFVTGFPLIRFYAGAPLITSAGYKIGSICVLDKLPQVLSLDQREGLKILSHQVMSLLELRKQVNSNERA